MQIALANPRGFCAGVSRAINIVEQVLIKYGPLIYVRHEIVHNRFIIEDFRSRGVVFVNELCEIPDDSVVIFSAHGVAKHVYQQAEVRGLMVIDATCPLVTKIHRQVDKLSVRGYDIVIIGKPGHAEIVGIQGHVNTHHGSQSYLIETVKDAYQLEVRDTHKLAYVTQTTLSVDETKAIIDVLQSRFKNIIGPDDNDICYATQNRQQAVKDLARQCDVVLVVGSKHSSNSNSLRLLVEKMGTAAYLIDEEQDINPEWLSGKLSIGITAGASVPELLVQRVVENFKGKGVQIVRELSGCQESVVFRLPKTLEDQSRLAH